MADNTQTFNFESKKVLNKTELECAVRIDGAEGTTIKRVLSVKALPKITTSEKVGEAISFSGKNVYSVVYESEEGELKSLYADADFSGTVNSSSEQYRLIVACKENTLAGSSASEVSISSLIEVEVEAIFGEKVCPIDGLDDSYVTSQKTYDYCRAINFVNNTFSEVAEQEYPAKVDDILSSFGDVVVENVFAGIDSVTVEGRVYITSSAIAGGKVVSINKELEFKEELSALSTLPSHLVDCSAGLASLKVSASVSDIDQKSTLIYSVELNVGAAIFAKETVSLVEDAFSLKNNVSALRECVLNETFEGAFNENKSLLVSTEIDREVEDICLVSRVNPIITELKESDEALSLCGWIEAELVCEAQNHEKTALNIKAPFALDVDQKKDSQFNIHIKSVSAKLKTKSEVELSLELSLEVKDYKSEFVSFLSQVEEGEEKQVSDAAIRVYVARDEDLFSVAKQLNMRPEVILEQNPGAAEKLVEGTRLVVYSPLSIDFE